MAGSKSRGTARSRINSGRRRRRPSTAANCPSVTTGSPAPVVLTTRSAAARACGELLPRHGLAAPAAGQLDRPVQVPVDDRHPADAFLLQVAERLLGHLAGADHQRLLVVEALEDARAKSATATLGMLTRRWWMAVSLATRRATRSAA